MKGCLIIVLIVITPLLVLAGPIGWILGIIAWILILK